MDGDKLFQFLVKSSMGKRVTQRKRTLKENKRERKRMCFPKTPHKKDNQQTLKIHLVTQEKTNTNTKTNKQTNSPLEKGQKTSTA